MRAWVKYLRKHSVQRERSTRCVRHGALPQRLADAEAAVGGRDDEVAEVGVRCAIADGRDAADWGPGGVARGEESQGVGGLWGKTLSYLISCLAEKLICLCWRQGVVTCVGRGRKQRCVRPHRGFQRWWEREHAEKENSTTCVEQFAVRNIANQLINY